jgi:hypothetical protein
LPQQYLRNIIILLIMLILRNGHVRLKHNKHLGSYELKS